MGYLDLLIVVPFYKPAYVYGGPVRSIPALCEAFASLNCDVTVYTTNANGKTNLGNEFSGPKEISGVHVHYFNRDLPGSYFYSKGLANACCQNIQEFDLVYIASNWGYPFLPASRAAYKAKIPYLISPRASFKKTAWKGKLFKKWTYHVLFERKLIQRASLIQYTTKIECDDSSWLRLRVPIVIVPNPINLEEFNFLPSKGIFRLRYHVPHNSRMILYLGRVEPAKGLDLALEAFQLLERNCSECILVIAGPEEENHFDYLFEKSHELGIKDKILFTGLLNSIERLEVLRDSDILILPSHSENFGMAVVEAMACGLPVVVSDQVGLANLIQKEKVGLVASLDAEKMASALISLLQNGELRQKMGRKAKRVVRQQFSPDVIARKFLDELGQIPIMKDFQRAGSPH